MYRTFLMLLLLASAGAVVPEYFAMGFRHILPEGPDHILFILGLFFLSRDARLLLTQLTFFTLAHSLTFGLALFGLVSVPGPVVEIAIALSIFTVAIGNLVHDRLAPWRAPLVFASGLVHGLGFAHFFGEKTISPAHFIPALFSFNIGIEIGQVAVVAIAWALMSICARHDSYRAVVARPASAFIAIWGLVGLVERIV